MDFYESAYEWILVFLDQNLSTATKTILIVENSFGKCKAFKTSYKVILEIGVSTRAFNVKFRKIFVLFPTGRISIPSVYRFELLKEQIEVICNILFSNKFRLDDFI